MREHYGECPVVIGITGHKDVRKQDESTVYDICHKALSEYKNRWENSRIIVLSALAEGVDRLAAKAALDLGLTLKVPLPMEEELYYKEHVPEQIPEYDALKAQAEEVYLINQYPDDEGRLTPQEVGYRSLAVHMAVSSHILLCLWDHKEVEVGKGGSFDTVNIMLSNKRASVYNKNLLQQATGIIHSVRMPRRKNPDLDRPFTSSYIVDPKQYESGTGSDAAVASYFALLDQLDTYNKEARSYLQSHTLQEERMSEGTLDSATARRFNEVFQMSNALSIECKKVYDKALKVNSVIGFLMFLSFLLYDIFGARTALIIYLLLMASLALFVTSIKRKGVHNRFIDYRSLAENMRVGIYWQEADIQKNVMDAHRFILNDALQWTRMALTSLTHEYRADERKSVPIEKLQQVVSDWITGPGGQLPYLQRSVQKKSRMSYISGRQARVFFVLSAIASTFFLLIELTVIKDFFEQTITISPAISAVFGDADGVQLSIKKIINILLAVLPAIGAIYTAYTDKLGLSDTIRDQKKMLELYDSAVDDLEQNIREDNPRAVQRILVELGDHALQENGNWVMLNRRLQLKVK